MVQHIHPELISFTSILLSLSKSPSIPTSPYSFSTIATFSSFTKVSKSFFIKVVLPAPRNPEIISTFI